jgi:hypothetical protein
MGNCIVMMFFGALLAAGGISVIDKPIQAIVILTAIAVALNFHKTIK